MLKTPHMVQLGMAGSHSAINYGCITKVDMGGCTSDEYLDIMNLDRYDMVIGIPFMRAHGVVLDTKRNQIRIEGRVINALPVLVGDTDKRVQRQRIAPKGSVAPVAASHRH